jgi:glycogen debranching enzyme
MGGIAEVHSGDAPHRAGGCLSQAWSVGESLAALRLLIDHRRGIDSDAFA